MHPCQHYICRFYMNLHKNTHKLQMCRFPTPFTIVDSRYTPAAWNVHEATIKNILRRWWRVLDQWVLQLCWPRKSVTINGNKLPWNEYRWHRDSSILLWFGKKHRVWQLVIINWWKGKHSGSIACTRKQQPRFYWSCSSVVMNDATLSQET